MNFQARYDRYLDVFERGLQAFCGDMRYEPPVLTESMRYSLLSGGKRVRPVLFFAALDLFGLPYPERLPLAIALECIHTYSLIHDDLPAMDNDDFRRGRPSNHKRFGEGNAILAGDALLSLAFDLLLRESKEDPRALEAAIELSRAAGAEGMIAGQSADLLYTANETCGERELSFVYVHKTGKLIAAPLCMAAAIAGREKEQMRAFGEELGTLFQLTDDILDMKGESAKMGKTLGKDEKERKLTCVGVYGLRASEELADACAARCLLALKDISGDVGFLSDFVSLVRNRNH